MSKKWWAVLAFAPCIAMFLMIVMTVVGYGTMFLTAATEGANAAGVALLIWAVLYMIIVFLALILTLGGMITFIVLACKNEKLDTGFKVLWVIIILNCNVISFPIYWALYMRQK